MLKIDFVDFFLYFLGMGGFFDEKLGLSSLVLENYGFERFEEEEEEEVEFEDEGLDELSD